MEELLMYYLRIALQYHVTDIHFSLKDEEQLKVEMRVGGIIRELKDQKADIRFFRYLLYRSNMDVSRMMYPQTGRFETEVDGTKISLRFALVSSYRIASGVLRILNNHDPLSIDELSTSPETALWMKSILNTRSGMFLFSGPTGSGKTTTLYTILNSAEGKKIFTLEDPIEIYSEKYVQLQVNEKQNLGYDAGIKQLMRHDPDIIMIGEIRDSTAARMAVRSALTGHLVVSTIHAQSCSGAVDRMIDLGVSRLQLQDVLKGISNQRLYSTKDGKRTGVYEVFNRKEIAYYFAHEHPSEDAVSLQDRIREAVAAGTVSAEEAAQDLA